MDEKNEVKNMEKNNVKNNSIYVIFLSTPTNMGKIIRRCTKYKYNHVAISLDKKLNRLYSFARYNYSAALVGGFVEESSLRYYNKQVDIKVCEIEVTGKQYDELIKHIEYMKTKADEYIYNSFSAVFSLINKKCKKENTYTCIEFVRDTLSKINLIDSNNINNIADLDNNLKRHVIYEGEMSGIAEFTNWGKDKYLEHINFLQICGKTIKHFVKLIRRKTEQLVNIT